MALQDNNNQDRNKDRGRPKDKGRPGANGPMNATYRGGDPNAMTTSRQEKTAEGGRQAQARRAGGDRNYLGQRKAVSRSARRMVGR